MKRSIDMGPGMDIHLQARFSYIAVCPRVYFWLFFRFVLIDGHSFVDGTCYIIHFHFFHPFVAHIILSSTFTLACYLHVCPVKALESGIIAITNGGSPLYLAEQ